MSVIIYFGLMFSIVAVGLAVVISGYRHLYLESKKKKDL